MTEPPKPPIAATRPHSFTAHNVKIDDPWAWLKDPGYPDVTDKDVLAYLAEENAYFEAVMAPHKALSDSLFQEMRGRIKEDESTVPQKDGDWIYWTDYETGGEYPRHWRRHVNGGEDQLILNEPALAEGKEYFRLGAASVSPDGRWLAYAVDDNGSERFEVRVKDLENGELLADTIPGMLSELVWTADSKGFLYGVANEQWRTDNARWHKLGESVADDIELFR
ncbi:MAG: S9 family peptidase, partial [Alphaproteobacteria bacterium]